MTVRRRLTALLLQAALLALPLSGARADCSAAHGAMTDMAGMPGMSMPDPGAGQHECPVDTAPPCDSMLVCTATVMVVEPVIAGCAAPVATIQALHLPRDPLSVTRAPEPPPPRA